MEQNLKSLFRRLSGTTLSGLSSQRLLEVDAVCFVEKVPKSVWERYSSTARFSGEYLKSRCARVCEEFHVSVPFFLHVRCSGEYLEIRTADLSLSEF